MRERGKITKMQHRCVCMCFKISNSYETSTINDILFGLNDDVTLS